MLTSAEAAEKLALVTESGDWYSNQLAAGCAEAVKKIGDAECMYLPSSSGDVDKQISIINNLVAEKVDGISVEPSNPQALLPALQTAKATHIPIVTIGNDLLEKDWPLRVANVGANNFQVGVRLAALLRQLKPKGGTICLVVDNGTMESFQQRLRGFRATLAGSSSEDAQGKRLAGENGWVEPDNCPIDLKDNLEVNYHLLDDVLGKPPGIDALVMIGSLLQSDPKAYTKLVENYRNKFVSGAPIFVGVGVRPAQIDLLEGSYSSGQVGAQPFKIGYTATMTLHRVVRGESVSPQTEVDLDICRPGKACEQQISCPDHEIQCTDNICRPKCN
jgi:ribose transport system substrate-binding protein